MTKNIEEPNLLSGDSKESAELLGIIAARVYFSDREGGDDRYKGTTVSFEDANRNLYYIGQHTQEENDKALYWAVKAKIKSVESEEYTGVTKAEVKSVIHIKKGGEIDKVLRKMLYPDGEFTSSNVKKQFQKFFFQQYMETCVYQPVHSDYYIAANNTKIMEELRTFSKESGVQLPPIVKESSYAYSDKVIHLRGSMYPDFIGMLYGGTDHPILSTIESDSFEYWKCHEDATPPFKKRPSDSGYDISLVREVESEGGFTLYGTGIMAKPPKGYYFDLVARSSLQNSGHLITNSIGVIDQGYRGEIMVGLYKFSKKAKKIELPFRCVQLVPRKIEHFRPVEGGDVDPTSRGTNGFGSTN